MRFLSVLTLLSGAYCATTAFTDLINSGAARYSALDVALVASINVFAPTSWRNAVSTQFSSLSVWYSQANSYIVANPYSASEVSAGEAQLLNFYTQLELVMSELTTLYTGILLYGYTSSIAGYIDKFDTFGVSFQNNLISQLGSSIDLAVAVDANAANAAFSEVIVLYGASTISYSSVATTFASTTSSSTAKSSSSTSKASSSVSASSSASTASSTSKASSSASSTASSTSKSSASTSTSVALSTTTLSGTPIYTAVLATASSLVSLLDVALQQPTSSWASYTSQVDLAFNSANAYIGAVSQYFASESPSLTTLLGGTTQFISFLGAVEALLVELVATATIFSASGTGYLSIWAQYLNSFDAHVLGFESLVLSGLGGSLNYAVGAQVDLVAADFAEVISLYGAASVSYVSVDLSTLSSTTAAASATTVSVPTAFTGLVDEGYTVLSLYNAALEDSVTDLSSYTSNLGVYYNSASAYLSAAASYLLANPFSGSVILDGETDLLDFIQELEAVISTLVAKAAEFTLYGLTSTITGEINGIEAFVAEIEGAIIAQLGASIDVNIALGINSLNVDLVAAVALFGADVITLPSATVSSTSTASSSKATSTAASAVAVPTVFTELVDDASSLLSVYGAALGAATSDVTSYSSNLAAAYTSVSSYLSAAVSYVVANPFSSSVILAGESDLLSFISELETVLVALIAKASSFSTLGLTSSIAAELTSIEGFVSSFEAALLAELGVNIDASLALGINSLNADFAAAISIFGASSTSLPSASATSSVSSSSVKSSASTSGSTGASSSSSKATSSASSSAVATSSSSKASSSTAATSTAALAKFESIFSVASSVVSGYDAALLQATSDVTVYSSDLAAAYSTLSSGLSNVASYLVNSPFDASVIIAGDASFLNFIQALETALTDLVGKASAINTLGLTSLIVSELEGVDPLLVSIDAAILAQLGLNVDVSIGLGINSLNIDLAAAISVFGANTVSLPSATVTSSATSSAASASSSASSSGSGATTTASATASSSSGSSVATITGSGSSSSAATSTAAAASSALSDLLSVASAAIATYEAAVSADANAASFTANLESAYSSASSTLDSAASYLARYPYSSSVIYAAESAAINFLESFESLMGLLTGDYLTFYALGFNSLISNELEGIALSVINIENAIISQLGGIFSEVLNSLVYSVETQLENVIAAYGGSSLYAPTVASAVSLSATATGAVELANVLSEASAAVVDLNSALDNPTSSLYSYFSVLAGEYTSASLLVSVAAADAGGSSAATIVEDLGDILNLFGAVSGLLSDLASLAGGIDASTKVSLALNLNGLEDPIVSLQTIVLDALLSAGTATGSSSAVTSSASDAASVVVSAGVLLDRAVAGLNAAAVLAVTTISSSASSTAVSSPTRSSASSSAASASAASSSGSAVSSTSGSSSTGASSSGSGVVSSSGTSSSSGVASSSGASGAGASSGSGASSTGASATTSGSGASSATTSTSPSATITTSSSSATSSESGPAISTQNGKRCLVRPASSSVSYSSATLA